MRAMGVVLIMVLSTFGNVQARLWKSAAGTELEAEYTRQAFGMVTLKTVDGKSVTLPISKLSDADQAHLRDLALGEAPTRAATPSFAGGGGGLRARTAAVADVASGDPTVVAQLQPGKTLTRTADGDMRTSYVVYTPASFSTNAPTPLIVAFSPGGNGNQMVGAMKATADRMGWLLVGCNALKNDMPDKALEIRMEDEVLNDLFAKLPHDRRRVYYAGFSGGACRSYHLTARRSEPVAGIVAYGGWLGGAEFHKLPYRKDMAIAMVNGDQDSAANSWVERDADVLKKRKCTVKPFAFAGGHQLPPQEITDACFQWLDQEWSRIATK